MPNEYVPLSGPESVSKGSTLKNFFANMMSDPGLSPMGLGFVAGSPGADAAVQSMIGGKAPTNAADAAIEFAKMKYPKLMSKVLPLVTQLDPNTAGAWNPYPKMVGAALKLIGNRETGPMIINSAPTIDVGANPAPLANLLSKVDTVGHEVTHGAIQATRTPQMFKNYINPNGPGGFAAYLNQPAEVNARQGGVTAQKTFLNFLAHYPELGKFLGVGQ